MWQSPRPQLLSGVCSVSSRLPRERPAPVEDLRARIPASRCLRSGATSAPRGHVDCGWSVGGRVRGLRQSPRLPCLWSAPRLRHLVGERGAPRSQPCVASSPASRRGVTSIAERGLVTQIGTCGNRRASHVSGRLRGCVTSHARANPSVAALRGLIPPRHGACADAQPPRHGWGSVRTSPPPTPRDRGEHGAVGAGPLARPRPLGLFARGGSDGARRTTLVIRTAIGRSGGGLPSARDPSMRPYGRIS